MDGDFEFLKKKFVTVFLSEGRKEASQKLLFYVVFELKKVYGEDYKKIFVLSLQNLMPKIRLKLRKKAGITYKVPFFLKSGEEVSYAFKWLKEAVNLRSEFFWGDRIFKELVDAYNKKGSAFKKKEQLHNLGLLNRGFIKFLK